ncbi:hypothetical protein CUJ84_Chr002458 [Rhizobium leguminosarum]|uniref:Uncharacterized protein n=1 Tax=Rhizobium leguminosarum TaxID=384 RepID=A0A2K9Z3L5_RHILE|nr:hypothetical protein CUJ84_Chr002458 [Rhizobium leguminosarum]
MVFKPCLGFKDVNNGLTGRESQAFINCVKSPDVSLRYWWSGFMVRAFAERVDNGSVLIPSV